MTPDIITTIIATFAVVLGAATPATATAKAHHHGRIDSAVCVVKRHGHVRPCYPHGTSRAPRA
jgi:uncharacterized RmlC-like cupin family protein